MRRWQPIKTLNPYPQLFWRARLNQLRRPVSAPDPVSGWGQPIRDAPVHLMHCFHLLIAGRLELVWTTTQVLWFQAVDLTASQSDASSHYHMWPGKLMILLFVLFVSVCENICGNLLPLPHSTLQSYQQTSVTPILDSPSSWSSAMGTVLHSQL